jgi:hypothetical protein
MKGRLAEQVRMRRLFRLVTGFGTQRSGEADQPFSSESQQGKEVSEIHQSFGFALQLKRAGDDYIRSFGRFAMSG